MADNANTGMAFLSVDGQTRRLIGAFVWDPGTIDRETQKGMDGIHGKKLSPRAPSISMNLRDSENENIASLNAMEDATIYCELISGKTVTGRGMWQVGPTEVDSEEGTVTVKFEGPVGSVREGHV